VETLRPHQGRLLINFAGWVDRDLVNSLRGVLLCVDSSTVPDPDDPDEFNDHQLVGLRAELTNGEHVGDVVSVDHAPASDMLILRLPDGRTGLVPFVRAIVPEVDIAAGRVVLTPPDGLFDV
jgi:16S rRNA processing protein RimM